MHNVKLFIKTVDVTQSLNNAISMHMLKTPAKYALRKIEMRSVFLGKGRETLDHNIFTSVVPRRLVIGFVSAEAFAGNQKLSPFMFEHANVRSISAQAHGLTFPSTPYNFNFKQNDYVRAFVDMYRGLDMDTENRTIGISMNRYKTGWCFFVIPMTPTLEHYGIRTN